MGRSLTATRPAVWLGGIGRSARPRSRQDKDSAAAGWTPLPFLINTAARWLHHSRSYP
jgi:hypothetical protein